MPEIGEIKKAKELGLSGFGLHIWHACIGCGKERWVLLVFGQPKHLKCRRCAFIPRRGEKNHSWKGGRQLRLDGYIMVWLSKDDFFYPMANSNGYVLEHRLVVAKALGRCLQAWEIVHHKHTKYPAGSIEDKQDNRYPENLQIVSDIGHNQITIFERKIDKLLEQNQELKAEVRLLRWELKESKERDRI